MMRNSPLSGVFAAAITPLDAGGQLDLTSLPAYLAFLAKRGCHGALLLGTTGEGPSFAHHERLELMKAALQVRQEYPEFRLLAGTGTPSLEETVANTKAAFDLGLDGVVVLPPYYYRSAKDEGLYAWFSRLIQAAVPSDGRLLGYHIPSVAGVALSLDLISRMKDAYPSQFAGIKDSSSSLEHARQLGEQFGTDLVVFNGNDRLFSAALQASASGCITAMASLCSPLLRRVWDAYQAVEAEPIPQPPFNTQAGQDGILSPNFDLSAQEQLNRCRAIMDKHPPAPPLLKSMLACMHNFPRWTVRPPLLDLQADTETSAAAELKAAMYAAGNV